MNEWLDVVRREIDRFFRTKIADPRIGIVAGVDSVNYMAKVTLFPEGTTTGWLPIQSQWVGNGWGLVCLPNTGDQVYVSFQENDRSAGSITGRHFDNASFPNTPNRPPQGSQSGEFWLVHKLGAKIQLLNTGYLSFTSALGQSAKMTLNSDTEIDLGNLVNAVQALCTQAFSQWATTHTHHGIDSNGDSFTTSPPDQSLPGNALTTITKAN